MALPIDKQSDPTQSSPVQSSPAQSDPAQSDPAQSAPTHSDPARFALLVGINKYHDGIKDPPFHNLVGCLEDVEIIKKYLDKRNDTTIVCMTSPPIADPSKELFPSEELFPSKKNIEAQLDNVLKKSKSGDFFYFHFSGHGTRLPSPKGSPNHSDKDPSLVTADFACEKPAFRGRELNVWLEKFDKKGVHLLVTLDSCYSGNAWRNGDKTVRSIDPPGMSNDIEASKEKAQADSELRGNRDAVQKHDWSINPEHLALMTACGPNEKAHESSKGGKFTYKLFAYLEKLGHPATYTMAGAYVKQELQNDNQIPGVYGRNKLQFYESYVPFIVEPIVAQFDKEKNMITVPAGKAHGIVVGTEFRSYSLSPEVEFTISDADECTSWAKKQDFASTEAIRSIAIIPLRWYFSDKVEITVENGFPDNLSEGLKECLEKEIASPITVGEKSTTSHLSLNLKKETGEKFQIRGPEEVIGYSDPIRPLQLHNVLDSDLKNAVAKVIAHLARFKQILDNKGNTMDTPPFEVALIPNPTNQKEPFDDNTPFRLDFKNTSNCSLFVTVLNLTPGFGVQELEFDASKNCHVSSKELKSIRFRIKSPADPGWVANTLGEACRDIIRVYVSEGKSVSWRALEMPDIWDEFETSETQERPAVNSDGRHAVPCDWTKWWTEEFKISSQPEGSGKSDG